MKANLKNIFGLAALGMTLLATTVPTWAGKVTTGEVTIGSDQFSIWARGSLGGARYSTDIRQQIGCRAQIFSSYAWTSCYATDSAGRTLSCGSGDLKFVDMIHGMTDSSSIYFDMDNSSVGTCKNIMIFNGSDLLR